MKYIVCFQRGNFSPEGKIAILECGHNKIVSFRTTTADKQICEECEDPADLAELKIKFKFRRVEIS